MSTILTWIVGAIKIVIVLGTLITIHELGHFVVAKLCKVRVHKFAIGFGPKLFTKVHKETEYTLRLIPFGGFVQMEGEEERSDDENAFNKKPVWQRILIIAAGATVNIIFALIVYFGIAASTNTYYNTTVAELEDGALYEAGIREGDRIVSIDGDKVLTQREIDEIINENEEEMIFLVERDGENIEIPVFIEEQTRGYLGAAFDDSEGIVYVYPNSPADEVGLQAGDVVVSINGIENLSTQEIVNQIRSLVEESFEMKVLRSGEIVPLDVRTESVNGSFNSLECERINPGFFDGIKYALDETGYYFSATISGIADIFVGKTENVEVMGPVGIASEITETSTWSSFFYLMSAISLSLGIFNLFPIPALDGGRILILLIEGIRRKPMKEKVEQGLILAGFALIMLLAVFVTVKDVIKIF